MKMRSVTSPLPITDTRILPLSKGRFLRQQQYVKTAMSYYHSKLLLYICNSRKDVGIAMEQHLNPVQGKISCIYKVECVALPSKKRDGQTFSIVATDDLNQTAIDSDITNARVTEKIDGTCCFVDEYKGCAVLWARLDRKPTKGTMKRFKKYQQKHREWSTHKDGDEPFFSWKMPEDLKEVPQDWKVALNVEINQETGFPIPNENGHVPGWVPVTPDNKQYIWHSSVVDCKSGLALTLSPSTDKAIKAKYTIKCTPLNELVGKTLELIGTNINANPYGLGSKESPVHILVQHGIVDIPSFPATCDRIKAFEWFDSNEGSVEGVVFHCKNGNLFKLHRHHLNLQWPFKETVPAFSKSSVFYDVTESSSYTDKSMFKKILNSCNKKMCKQINESLN